MKLGIHGQDISPYISCVLFLLNKKLVVMTTDSSHRLRDWKKWKYKISATSLEIFDFFLQKCLLSRSPYFIQCSSKLLNLIG